MKCVIVVDPTLPVGLLANASAVLAMSIGSQIQGIIGEDVPDRDGSLHRGITRVTVPVLKGDAKRIRSLRDRLVNLDNGENDQDRAGCGGNPDALPLMESMTTLNTAVASTF
jgi:hypothetical protein